MSPATATAADGMLRMISYGGGVQSNALLVLAAQGRIDFRTFLFANVGADSENPATLEYVRDVAMPFAARHGIELVELQRTFARGPRTGEVETIFGRLTKPGSRSLPIPARMSNGAPGTRACTADFKVRIVARELRRRGATVEQPAVVGLGISVDEIERAKPGIDPLAPFQRRVYPLLDLGLRRSDCHQIITDAGLPIPERSACWFCLIWNLAFVASGAMIQVTWEKFPLVAGHDHARRWLQFTANIGRAPNTVLEYGRALEDHLRFCALVAADPLLLSADLVAGWIGDLFERPNPRAPRLLHLSSGAGLANATIQQRVVAVRSFYQFLVEDGLREQNPVRRGQSGGNGRRAKQGLVRRLEPAPWIPNEWDWQRILEAAAAEPLRNRLILGLAYDGALRREELVGLEVGDFEPAYSLIHLRAETTKSKCAREVTFGAATTALLMAYLAERRQLVGRRDGSLLVSCSRRNRGAPLGGSNTKVIPVLCRKAGIPESDSRGALTSHRARATIATQLLNAREPLSLADLQQWLGHKHASSTRHYAAILQRTLAGAYKRADYFARNVRTIQVLIDREAVLNGAAAGGEPWKYYDLGDGYCSYGFFAKCPHRLACARCPFYLPKDSTKGQLLAVRDGIEQMLEQLDLTDDERAALEGDRDAITALAQKLADVPTPAGPTPDELGTEPVWVTLTGLRGRSGRES